MGTWSLAEKIIAGLVVALIVAAITYVVLPRWRRRRRVIVRGGGQTGQTYVSAGTGNDGVPDILVKNQNGQLRICVETQPMGHVVFRYINPSTGGPAYSVIVLAVNQNVDMRDHAGAALSNYEINPITVRTPDELVSYWSRLVTARQISNEKFLDVENTYEYFQNFWAEMTDKSDPRRAWTDRNFPGTSITPEQIDEFRIRFLAGVKSARESLATVLNLLCLEVPRLGV